MMDPTQAPRTRACKSCGKHMRMAETLNGKYMPLTSGEAAKRNIIVDEDNVMHVVAPGEGDYVSHFSDCTEPDKYRGQGVLKVTGDGRGGFAKTAKDLA